jgi:uncharacterized repeat protein (TIGR03803 family)
VKGRPVSRPVLTLAIVLAIVIAANHLSDAQTYSVLYSFGGVAGDGNGPTGTLIQDSSGNLYGTTQGGGQHGVGTVFRLTASGTETLLYDFNLPPDAILPAAGLYRDAEGRLYGTTRKGGVYGPTNGSGAVFKLDTAGNETVVHSFGKGEDGNEPECVLIADAKGNLYGTTGVGGRYGFGTVFRISASGRETVLHHFTGADGAVPAAGLIRDAQGNLFGTTVSGGKNGFGTVFKLAADGKETVLYSFCSARNCTDGGQPVAGLIQDQFGNLFGTTGNGGRNGQGAVFELTKGGKEIVLHSFGTFGSGDGRWPWAGLILDQQGNLYGTTYIGGAYDSGTVFKVDRAGKETVLHSFCAEPNCVDGVAPAFASLLRDRAGNLYGVAQRGVFQSGVVFRLTP